MAKKELCPVCGAKVAGFLDTLIHMQTHSPEELAKASAESTARLREVMEEIYPRRIG